MCSLAKANFHNKSKDIFDFLDCSGGVEERINKDKRPLPIKIKSFGN